MKKMISAFSIFMLAATLILSTQLVRANNIKMQTMADEGIILLTKPSFQKALQ